MDYCKRIAKKYLPKRIKKAISWFLFDVLYRYRLAITKGEKKWEEPIKKLREKKKIKIAFVFGSASYWAGDLLYDYFANDSRFEAFVVVIPFFNGTNETIRDEYERTLLFFKAKQIPVIGTVKDDLHKNRTWKECGAPDIIYYANPYIGGYPMEWHLQKLPSNILTFYIPYGFMVADLTRIQFNQKSHHLFWRIFCESNISKQLFVKYSYIGDRNVVFSGYPKMDAFYHSNKEHRWKGKANAKRFIYSPHHSLSKEKHGLGHSTFLKNYKYMLELAKKYSETTSWVFRPHPFLEKACIEEGVFTKEQWQDYLDCWNNLPNGEVQISGEYISIFQTCDGVINDSVSYMAEILYAHKPMLYLKAETAAFNDFGKILEKIHYKCAGDNYQAIEDFILMILSEEDPMKGEREKFFQDNLDYKALNGMTASYYIYKYIRENLLDS